MRKEAQAAGAKLPSKNSQDWIVSTQAGPASIRASKFFVEMLIEDRGWRL
jgi:hypothetical protein